MRKRKWLIAALVATAASAGFAPAVIYRPRPVYVATPYPVYYRRDGRYWHERHEERAREYRRHERRERDDD